MTSTAPSADVLVVGATGTLGSRIATHLIADGAAVRLLTRPATQIDPARAATLAPLIAAGATMVEGDLADVDSLAKATAGIDVVVSAVQGGPAVVVDGQLALARAAAANGVRRIVPSDFALDLFKAPPGVHPLFDLRRTADDAKYTARAALDPAVPNGKLAVAGDHVSFQQMTNTVEAITGRTYTRRSLGTSDDLHARIEQQRHADPTSMAWISLVYLLFMVTGQTSLDDLQNARYPDLHPETFDSVARRLLAG